MQPFPSPFLSDWERNPQIAQLTVFYTGQIEADFRVELRFTNARRGLLGRVVSGTFPVPFGPHTELLTNPEVVDWGRLDYEAEFAERAQRTGVLPEGEYEVCARILDLQGRQRTETCARFTVLLPDPPELIVPSDGEVVTSPLPVFQWTPVPAPPEL
nr:hypothetical protein [Gemmatimonadota bacterium]NIR81492.1 hypothetical protein [Gemmatimonadota bacterium]NIU34164.1 hypothetical protein [Gemmatimonadota bacterium]NIU38315.1 hypothetical protein [Gemmatimonadota bacterium]NIV64483.1 hypothetical protein [Gemmatimonadota bacterium]